MNVTVRTLALAALSSIAVACLPSGSNGGGGGGGVTIIDGDAGTTEDTGSNEANNTQPTTKTCSDGSEVPIEQPCNCPQSAADCDDGDPCTQEIFTSGDTCGTCSSAVINACGAIDGCCPAACNVGNDNDCTGCGNGRIDPGETCDGDCPAPFECPEPTRTCQTVTYAGEPDVCTAECVIEDIVACVSGDGCCPEDCDVSEDTDCGASSGSHGEACANEPGICADLNENGFCLTPDIVGEGFPVPDDGICTSLGCAEGVSRCNNGTECVATEGASFCLRRCRTDADCRRDDVTCQGPSDATYCL